jgi:predicted metal-dependent peptidase
MKMIADETCPSATTDGVTIKYNPAFVETLNLNEATGLIAHMVMHVALLHPFRREGRDPHTWNDACDYAINIILKDCGFSLLKDEMLNESFRNMSAEQVYTAIRQQKQKDSDGKNDGNNSGTDNGNTRNLPEKPPGFGSGWGNVADAPAATTAEKRKMEDDAKQIVVRAATVAKMQGNLPGSLERFVEDILEAKVNWREQLRRLLTEIARNDYSFRLPNPRYAHTGLYLPSLHSEEMAKIALAVDTSGSISQDEINAFAAEIRDIKAFTGTPVTVIYCDTQVRGTQELVDDEPLKPVGGGGTSFRPPFEHIDRNGPAINCLIYLTDGHCDRFPACEPAYLTVWAVTGNRNFQPPFGEKIFIEKN